MLSSEYMADVTARFKRGDSVDNQKLDQLSEAIKGLNNDDVVAELESLRNDISGLQDAIKSMQVVLDSGELVGGIAEDMDTALGMRAIVNSRGRY